MTQGTTWWTLFDWGGTLMSEDGPLDIPMALWPEVHAIAGARETLAELAACSRIGIVTNATISRRNMIELALGRVGLREPVAEIFCYTEIGARKDNPAFWKHVLATLRVPPSRVVVIGDSLEQDVLAPREHGIFSIWFDEAGRRGDGSGKYPVVRALADAVPIVLALHRSRQGTTTAGG